MYTLTLRRPCVAGVQDDPAAQCDLQEQATVSSDSSNSSKTQQSCVQCPWTHLNPRHCFQKHPWVHLDASCNQSLPCFSTSATPCNPCISATATIVCMVSRTDSIQSSMVCSSSSAPQKTFASSQMQFLTTSYTVGQCEFLQKFSIGLHTWFMILVLLWLDNESLSRMSCSLLCSSHKSRSRRAASSNLPPLFVKVSIVFPIAAFIFRVV